MPTLESCFNADLGYLFRKAFTKASCVYLENQETLYIL